MTLIANYRGLRHTTGMLDTGPTVVEVHGRDVRGGSGDGHRSDLRVRTAVAAVHGSVGGAFGVPFAFEGLFFFTEAIFIAIYIFGWRRLKPWAHFWTRYRSCLPEFGSISVVAANAWMNAPAGFTLDSNGNVITVDPSR